MSLRKILTAHRIGYAELGRAVTQAGGRNRGRPLGPAAVSQIVNHGIFPATTPEEEVKRQIEAFLKARGIAPEPIQSLWGAAATAPRGEASTQSADTEDKTMLPPKAKLTPESRKLLGLGPGADPFGDVETDSQLVLTPQLRYLREALMDTMRNGGFCALVGESGSGKTTLIEECQEGITREGKAIILIRPPIVGMDTEKEKGSVMKARNILHFIVDVIAPSSKRAADTTRFSHQVQRHLADRAKLNERVCLVIDDAHRLNGHTLKHLKDFYEFKDGRKRLLSIILLGQLPLAQRLHPTNGDLIQISQRCEVLMLAPLDPDPSPDSKHPEIDEYLRARLSACRVDAAKVFGAGGITAMRQRLTVAASRGAESVRVTYPLAINNLAVRAINLAAALGAPQVTADIVREA